MSNRTRELAPAFCKNPACTKGKGGKAKRFARRPPRRVHYCSRECCFEALGTRRPRVLRLEGVTV